MIRFEVFRMSRKISIPAILVGLCSFHASAGEFDPGRLEGLRLWLSANESVATENNAGQGGSERDVFLWKDRSPHANHVRATNDERDSRPEWIPSVPDLGGEPAIDGKGGSDFSVTESLLGRIDKPFDLDRATVFLVARWNHAGGLCPFLISPSGDSRSGRGGVAIRRGRDPKGWFCVHNGGAGGVERLQTTEPPLDDEFHVLAVTFDKSSASIRMFLDGALQNESIRHGSKLPLDPVRFIQIGGQGLLEPAGAPGSEWYFGGQIAEIVVFDRVLSRSSGDRYALDEFGAVGWYLQEKYGLEGRFEKPVLPTDTDRDGLLDAFEDEYAFLDPKDPTDARGDHDEDGLSHLKEFELGTKPDHPDSDGDGLSDGAEVNEHGTSPTNADSDRDGLPDGVELTKLKTNPAARDSDGDRMPDGFEIFSGTNPADATSRTEPKYDVRDEEVVFGTVAVAMDGTVLLFEENREAGRSEVKRSEDGGATWSEPIVVGKRLKIDGDMSDDGRYRGPHVGWSELGTVVVDENTGDIMVFTSGLKPVEALFRSKDHGKTWTTEKITIKPDKNGWLPATLASSDPGVTLQWGPRKGRLLVPTRVFVEYLNKGKGRKFFDKHYASAIYSDDGGKTWTPSEPFPLGGTGESGLVELRDGTIYYNSRTHSRPGFRRICYSDDAGETWRDEHEDDELWDGPPDVYGCKGALARMRYDDRDVLLFSTPGRRDTRTDITVHVSLDGGQTWPFSRMVKKGPGNYTWLAVGRDGTPSAGWIYLLAGKDWFARFNLAWLFEDTSVSAKSKDPSAWAQFRGPNGSGIADGLAPPVEFGAGKNELWRTPLASGHSSPCISGDSIFLTTYEAESKKLSVVCLDRANGKERWSRGVSISGKVETGHPSFNPASSTPACDGERVVAYFGSYGLLCFDLRGEKQWEIPMPLAKSYCGNAASPIIVGDRAILYRGNYVDHFLLAVDKRTGKELWKVPQKDRFTPDMACVAMPIVAGDRLVLHSARSVQAFDLSSGERIWRANCSTTATSTPVLYGDNVIVATWNQTGEPDLVPVLPSFEQLLAENDKDDDALISKKEFPRLMIFHRSAGTDAPHNGAPLRFGSGDQDRDGKLDREEWTKLEKKTAERRERLVPHGLLSIPLPSRGVIDTDSVRVLERKGIPEVPSPLVHENMAYLVKNGGLLTCVDLETGKTVKRMRTKGRGTHYASPIIAGGKLYATAGDGKISVLTLGASPEILAVNEIGERVYATPAVVDGTLYIRTHGALVAYREGAK